MKSNLAESRIAEAASARRTERSNFAISTFSYDGMQQVLRQRQSDDRPRRPPGDRRPERRRQEHARSICCAGSTIRSRGEVLIDGVSLRDVAIKDLRSRIALVTQQTELFNESILHNIRYGRWDATEEEVEAAARLARAHEFISAFPARLSHNRRPERPALERRPAAANRPGPRVSAQRRNTDSRRGHQPDRRRKRAADPRAALAEFGQDRTLIMITHRESTLSLATIVRLNVAASEHSVPNRLRMRSGSPDRHDSC